MKTFNPINRQYVAPIELSVVQNSLSTLEKGHQQAVKVAAEMKQAMANLDLNEAEDGWKQSKLAEFQTIINNKSLHGNAYGALDDLVLKGTDLFVGADTLGRIRANADYKKYMTALDNANIEEGMKDMYRELNPYKYEDIVDKNTGKIIGGTKWEPNKRPVAQINTFELMKNALSIAAKESGSRDSVMFLDENGNPTSDPSKSFDGSMYTNTTTKWERLPANKIMRAIKTAIDSTPGAQDSLKQDYEYALWKYKKNNIAKNGIVDNELTDANGNMFTFDDFIQNKMRNFAAVTEYNNVSSNIQYGNALENYRKRLLMGAGVGVEENEQAIPDFIQSLSDGGTKGMIEVTHDVYSDAANGKAQANKEFLTLYKNLGGDMKGVNSISDITKRFGNGPHSGVTNLIKYFRSNGVELDDDTKNALYNSSLAFYNYNRLIASQTKGLSDDDKKSLSFNASMVTRNYAAGRSKQEDELVNQINKLRVSAPKGTIFYFDSGIESSLPLGDIQKLGFKVSRNSDGKAFIKVNPNEYNKIGELSNLIEFADSKAGFKFGDLGNLFTGDGLNSYTVRGIQGDGNEAYLYGGDTSIGAGFRRTLSGHTRVDKIASAYNKAVSKAASIQTKLPTPRKSYMSATSSREETFAAIKLQHDLANGLIDEKGYNLAKKSAKDRLYNSLSNFDIGSAEIYELGEDNIYRKTMEPGEISADIMRNASISKEDNKSGFTVSAGLLPFNDKLRGGKRAIPGHYISFEKDGVRRSFFVKGIMDETEMQMAGNTRLIAKNMVNEANASKGGFNIIEYDKAIGSVTIKGNGDDTYNVNFVGKNYKLDAQRAENFASDIQTTQAIKSRLMSLKSSIESGIPIPPNVRDALNNAIKINISNISNSLGANPNTIGVHISRYLATEED